VAPEAGSFKAGLEYTHGGLSLQECLVPEFTVRTSGSKKDEAAVQSIKWVGLRCRVQTTVRNAGIAAELRSESGDKRAGAAAKDVEADGQVSLLVTDDRLDHKKAIGIARFPVGVALRAAEDMICRP
jgi:hypothetical protein